MRRKITSSVKKILATCCCTALCTAVWPVAAQDAEPRFTDTETQNKPASNDLFLAQLTRQRPGAEERDILPEDIQVGAPPGPTDLSRQRPGERERDTLPPDSQAPTQTAALPEPQYVEPITPGFRRRPGEEQRGPIIYPATPGYDRDFEVGEQARTGPQELPYIEPQPLPDPNRATGLRRTQKPDPLAPTEFIPIPDRWRLATSLGLVNERWFDPYNFNILKADRPVFDKWFVNIGIISDTIIEPRKLPTMVAPQVSQEPGDLDIFGGRSQFFFNQNLITSLVVIDGNTVFRPPDYEFRITPVFNYNYLNVKEDRIVKITPLEGDSRNDGFVGMQELFLDVHLRNVSDRYDFDSVRVGIQPFNMDFRGFLFQDNQLGVRLFGTRDNNIYQYNLGAIWRVEKDTNSGLNDIFESDLRDDYIFFANLFRQDWPVRGFTSQATVVYNRNHEDDALYFDNNGFLARPASLGQERLRNYDVVYLGLNGDGHFGRLNLTTSFYAALGDESVGTFTSEDSDIRAFFAAAEASVDFDWIRLRASGLYGSGDGDPFDGTSKGFDAIFENPIFAGADTNFWIRQAVPLVGGGGVTISNRNGVLNALRSSKEQGQSNFTNPGMILLGVGADFDVTPEFRISTNINHMWFDDTAPLEAARNQGPIDNDIGWDLSVATIYRPFFTQNIVFRLSGAALIAGDGYEQLFGDEVSYSVLGNLILTY